MNSAIAQEQVIKAPLSLKEDLLLFLTKNYQSFNLHTISDWTRSFFKDLNTYFYDFVATGKREEFYNICANHAIDKLFLEDPQTKRSRQKPRGYAGDAELIDYIYRLKSPAISDTFRGKEIFTQIMNSSSCNSVRWRAIHMAEKIDEVCKNMPNANILALASGHLRELHYVKEFVSKINQFYAIDQDPLSNEEAKRSLPYHNIHILNESILSVIAGKFKPSVHFDLIYSSGLFDYLNDKLASALIKSSINLLQPGGRLVVGNFAKGIKEQAYMEAFMDWHLIYRDERDMEGLITEGVRKEVEDVRMYRDEMENVVYMEVERR